MLVDSTDFNFPVLPESQSWAAENHINLGVPKVGFILSKDVFAQVSIEMAVDQFSGIDTQYFDDIEAARKWAQSK